LIKDSLPSDETFTTSSLDAAREYVIAQNLLGEGRQDEAVPHYQKALEFDPQMGRAYSGWAACDNKMGKPDDARAHMAKALELLPRMNRREQLRTLGLNSVLIEIDYQRAVDTYETLLREYPADSSAQNNLALARFMLLDFKAAKTSAARLVELSPHKAMYRGNLALYGMYAGDFETAVREARQAIALNPKDDSPYVVLAVNAAYQGTLPETRRWYEEMAKGDSAARRLSVIGLADMMVYAGELHQARTSLAPAIPADLGERSAGSAARKYLVLGELALLAGDRDFALDAAQKATSLLQSPQVLFRASMLLLAADKVTEAGAAIAQLPQTLQGSDLWYRRISEAYASAGRGDADAVTRFEKQLSENRGTWLAHLHAGLLRLRSGDARAALRHLNWTVEHRYEASAAYLDDVPTIRYWSDAWYWSGVANEMAGDRQAAKVRYESFLASRARASDGRTTEVRSRLERLK